MPTSKDCLIRMCTVRFRRAMHAATRPANACAATYQAGWHELTAPEGLEDPATAVARAVATSHADALGTLLSDRALPWSEIEIRSEAACIVARGTSSLEEVAVASIVFGGDPGRQSQYAAASRRARDRSLVGRTIRGNIAYKIGGLTVLGSDRLIAPALCNAGGAGERDHSNKGLDGLMMRHLTAFNGHLVDKVIATIHPSCTLEDMVLDRQFQGRGVVDDYYHSWWDAFGLTIVGPRCYYAGDEAVTAEAHCVGTHAGTFRGIAPTHHRIDLRTAAMLRIRDGLIAEAHIYYDAVSLLRQLGVPVCDAQPFLRGDQL